MRAIILAIIVWLAAAAGAGAQAPLAVIPYKVTSEGSIAIDVMVDGKGPYSFIVDTGATLSLVFENFARAANPPRAEGPSIRVLSISGARLFEPYAIGELKAGIVLARARSSVVLPDWDAPRETPAGIIGLDILENFAIALDRTAKTIALYDAAGLPEALTGRMRKVSMKQTRYAPAGASLFTVRGRINGEPIDFIVDLGLATTLINYAAADSLFSGTLSVATGRTPATGTRLDDVFDDRTRVNAGIMRSISVGSRRWSRKPVWIYDAPLFDELGVQRLAYGLLGADLLTAQDVAIDFTAKKIYFGRR